jgi:hypothetical protein
MTTAAITIVTVTGIKEEKEGSVRIQPTESTVLPICID